MIRLPTRVADLFAGPFLVGVAAVAVFAVWAANDAGYASTTWYPGGLFLLALAVVTVVAYGGVSLSPSALVAIVFLGAFAAWCALSITWASDKGIAWDGANRTVLYFLVYALFVSLPWRRESIPFLLVGFSLAVLAIGLVALARSAGDPSAYFMKGRFSAPAGYPNAACALYLLAFWPVAYAAVRRELPVVVRGGLMAAAAALVELALLCQSRGSLFAVPIAIVAYLLIVPGRLRAAIGLAFVALTVLSVRTRLLDVFEPIRDGQGSRAAVHRALAAIGISCAAAFAVWSLVSLLDRRVDLGARTVRTANLAGLTLAGAALVAGLVFVGTSSDRIDRSWHNFKAGYPTQTTSSHFSLGLGSNRYDFWRVAVLEFRHHPLQGVGVDNFAQDYILERRSGEEPLYPHSLELRVLGQTGVIGTLLFAGFLVAAVLSVVKARGTDLAGGLARAGVAAAAYIAIHGSADWFWEFPALTAPALAWLGPSRVGVGADDARAAGRDRRGGARVRRRRRLVRLSVGRRARGPQGGRRLGEQSPRRVRGSRSLSEPESSEHSRGPAGRRDRQPRQRPPPDATGIQSGAGTRLGPLVCAPRARARRGGARSTPCCPP